MLPALQLLGVKTLWGTAVSERGGGTLWRLEHIVGAHSGLAAGRESRLEGGGAGAATSGQRLELGSSTSRLEIQLSHHQQLYKIKKNRNHQSAMQTVKEIFLLDIHV